MKKFENVFEKYKKNYEDIFNILYPAKNTIGFTERNLSVNFCKAYESIYPEAVTWFEFQFGEKNNFYYDAVIINPKEKEILFIESKRFNNNLNEPKNSNEKSKRIQDIIADVSRINRMGKEYEREFAERILDCSSYTLYGIVLADVWTINKNKSPNKRKTEIYESFKEKNFVNKNNIPIGKENPIYHIIDFDNIDKADIKNYYHLVSFAWKIALN